jgi:hypothetical protein
MEFKVMAGVAGLQRHHAARVLARWVEDGSCPKTQNRELNVID